LRFTSRTREHPPSVKNLRKRALDVAKAELDEKADLTFTYMPTKNAHYWCLWAENPLAPARWKRNGRHQWNVVSEALR
jgi:hypothetical protein